MSRKRKQQERTGPEPPPSSPAPSASTLSPARKPSGFSNLLLHLHPRMIPEETLQLSRTFGLGGMALLLFLVLGFTGALLLFVYEPSIDRAYESVRTISDDVPFGSFLRAVHHWAGNGLLLLAFLHLLRVVYTGAFLPPRRFNWILGLFLLVLVMAGNFTGYLLPWDQLAYWAVTIGTGMLQYIPFAGDALVQAARGGEEIGPKTLSLFFVAHIALLPILLFILMSFHFWKVRKAGGVMLPRDRDTRPVTVPVQPNLTLREGTAALVLLAALLLAAAVFPAPLEDQANPGMSPNPAKAPWYFMGMQELLIHLHPVFAILVVPLIAIILLAGFPFLHYDPPHSGKWFHSLPGRGRAIRACLAAVLLIPLAVLADEFALHWAKLLPDLPSLVSTGLIPLILWSGVFSLILFLIVRGPSSSRTELVQSAFTFLATGLLVLTAIGVFFRGQGMRLIWPW